MCVEYDRYLDNQDVAINIAVTAEVANQRLGFLLNLFVTLLVVFPALLARLRMLQPCQYQSMAHHSLSCENVLVHFFRNLADTNYSNESALDRGKGIMPCVLFKVALLFSQAV